MATLEELYKAQQTALGVSAISFDAGVNAKTPYTTNDLKKVDDQILTATKFNTGRGGTKAFSKYSDSKPK